MEAKLIINGVDFIPWCKRDGIQQTDIQRKVRSVITLGGKLYEKAIVVRGISVSLVELRDETLARLTAALESPATVEYTDMKYGDRTRTFYVRGITVQTKVIQGGNTYWDGTSFSLEEV